MPSKNQSEVEKQGLRPNQRNFRGQSEENMVNFEDEFLTDSEETKSPSQRNLDDEFGENLKSNIEQNLEDDRR